MNLSQSLHGSILFQEAKGLPESDLGLFSLLFLFCFENAMAMFQRVHGVTPESEWPPALRPFLWTFSFCFCFKDTTALFKSVLGPFSLLFLFLFCFCFEDAMAPFQKESMELLQKVHDLLQLSLLGLLVGPALLHDRGWDPPLLMEYLLLVRWAKFAGWKQEDTWLQYWNHFQSNKYLKHFMSSRQTKALGWKQEDTCLWCQIFSNLMNN